MDPIVFELLGSVLVGGMIWLTILRRPKNTPLATMPVLAVRKTRQVSSNRHRQPSSSNKVKNKAASPGPTVRRRRTKTKTGESTDQANPALTIGVATATLETCPSCGLQAPDKLLAEHFLGSPSHRNGPEKVATIEPTPTEADSELREDDSKQSVRNLLQILVPPRAFGRRHAHRSIGPISPIVQNLGPSRRNHL